MMMINRVVDLTKTVRVVVLMKTVPVVATAVLTTVLVTVAAAMTKKSHAVAARATSGRKTRCMTARKLLVKSA
jgi:hypothetical protein